MRDQLGLELVDLGVGAHPLLLGGESLDALHQHASVPAAIEDRQRGRAGRGGARSATDNAVRALRLLAPRLE